MAQNMGQEENRQNGYQQAQSDAGPAGPDGREGSQHARAGWLQSWQRLGGKLLALAEVRLALLGTEIEAEKLRWIQALVSALSGLLLAAAALAMLSLGLLLFCPAPWRWAAALGLGLFYAVLAWWQWCRAQQQLNSTEGMFAASLAELARDREALERSDV